MFLYIVPTICDPLVSQPIATSIEKINSPKGLDFAHNSNGKSSLQVDVFIGSEYYRELVKVVFVDVSADSQPFILNWPGCCQALL